METRILDGSDPSGAPVREAANIVRSGYPVAFPTETVYGLGALATQREAVARVFDVKGRPADNPLIVHVAEWEQLRQCGTLHRRFHGLIDAFMPGPLTLVISSGDEIPEIVRAGLPTVAVRMPDHPVAHQLLRLTGPLVAPSANRSGRPSPTTAQHVIEDLGGLIPAILDGGPCRIGIESTVLDVSGPHPVILRPGAVTLEELQKVCGEDVTVRQPGDTESRASRSPGTRHRHYAPEIPVRLFWGPETPAIPDDTVRILASESMADRLPPGRTRPLEAESFYAELRKAETDGCTGVIIAADRNDISAALLDRIVRAANPE
jgi:L-threonylcarbamoyladenylate synthase